LMYLVCTAAKAFCPDHVSTCTEHVPQKSFLSSLHTPDVHIDAKCRKLFLSYGTTS
jgi:hypothetical protein